MEAPFPILLAEDEETDVHFFKRAFGLARIQHPLFVVRDGKEALDYLQGIGQFTDRRAFPIPKLIFLDIKMPRRTGLEVLEWLKGDGPLKRIPVIMISSSAIPTDVNKAYELGASAYMVKPVDFSALQQIIVTTVQFFRLGEPPHFHPDELAQIPKG